MCFSKHISSLNSQRNSHNNFFLLSMAQWHSDSTIERDCRWIHLGLFPFFGCISNENVKTFPYFGICGFEFSKFVKSNIQSSLSLFFFICTQIVSKFLICIYYLWRSMEARGAAKSWKHCGSMRRTFIKDRYREWIRVSKKFLWF